jgi:transcriptional regulator with XRE-family HTH domain
MPILPKNRYLADALEVRILVMTYHDSGALNMTFGQKLKDARIQIEVTQAALAEASGVPLGTLREYEQGIREPSLARAQKLAAALGKTLNDLAGDLEKPKPAKAKRKK